ncbi:hypothetical protein [Salinibacter ruber]|uniref:hypothetical protein n=1 Tax=Salinibacter ruber TaxID=146919 RepID=UPI002169EB44|nr:hypothetical protein [Salinibacter ruber]MCS3659903.1 hypothetical protein [Salinibacter ruber]MCS4170230.1 hypothetical protein [Salinibacter ruber]
MEEDDPTRWLKRSARLLTRRQTQAFPAGGRTKKPYAIENLIYKALRIADMADTLDLMSAGSELRDYLIANHVDDASR